MINAKLLRKCAAALLSALVILASGESAVPVLATEITADQSAAAANFAVPDPAGTQILGQGFENGAAVFLPADDASKLNLSPSEGKPLDQGLQPRVALPRETVAVGVSKSPDPVAEIKTEANSPETQAPGKKERGLLGRFLAPLARVLPADASAATARSANDKDFARLTGEKLIASAPEEPSGPILETSLHQAEISLRLNHPFNVLALNARLPELKDESLYQKLSGGKASLQIAQTQDPQSLLADARNSGRFRAVVWDGPSAALPARGTSQWRKLKEVLEQLGRLHLKDSSYHRRPKVKPSWLRLDGNLRQDFAPAELIHSLYQSLADKGTAILTFNLQDKGVMIWQRLLQDWCDADGGRFLVQREDLEDGGHVIVARRVGSEGQSGKGLAAPHFVSGGVSAQIGQIIEEASRIHRVDPVGRKGINGEGETAMLVDMAGQITDKSLALRTQGLDLVDEGPEGWQKEGSVEGHTARVGAILLVLASRSRGILAKIYSRWFPPSAKEIIAAGDAAQEKGVSVLSLPQGFIHDGPPARGVARFLSQLALKIIVVVSAGNTWLKDRSVNTLAGGENVIAVAAAKAASDGGKPQIEAHSAVGPAVLDYGHGIERKFLKPDIAAIDGGLGTSAAQAVISALALLLKQAFRKTRKINKPAFAWVWERLPLAAKAVFFETSRDLDVPPWFQGAGSPDLLAAVNLVYAWRWPLFLSWLSNIPGLKMLALKPGQEPWAWIGRYVNLLEVENRIFQELQTGSEETQELRFRQAVKADLPHVLARLDAQQEGSWAVRRQAALMLMNFKDPSSAQALLQSGLHDPEPRVRAMALLALAEMPDQINVNASLRQALLAEKARWDVALYSAFALWRRGDNSGAAYLESAAKIPNNGVRLTAVWLLGQLGSQAQSRQADILAGMVKDSTQDSNVRHLALRSLANLVAAAPQSIHDQALIDILSVADEHNADLNANAWDFFAKALLKLNINRRLRQDPLKTAVGDWAFKFRKATVEEGALGRLVLLLAHAAGRNLNEPTPVLDPGGKGVPGVDPALGFSDLIVALPKDKKVSAYWNPSLGDSGAPARALQDAGFEADLLSRFRAELRGAFPLSGALYIRVPQHKLFALRLALERRGYKVQASRPYYSLSKAGSEDNRVLDAGDRAALARVGSVQNLPLIRIRANRGASEARVMAALEEIYARADPLRRPVTIVAEIGGPVAANGNGSLERLIRRLALNNIGIVLPTGNSGPAENTLVSPADAGVGLVVAGAQNKAQVQPYSSRGSRANPGISFAESDNGRGTAAAALKAAENKATLSLQMVRVFQISGNGRLPDGYSLYIDERSRQALSEIPNHKPLEVGGGKALETRAELEVLEEKLKNPQEVVRESGVLIRQARQRVNLNVIETASGSGQVPKRSLWNRLRETGRRRLPRIFPGPKRTITAFDQAQSRAQFAPPLSPEQKNKQILEFREVLELGGPILSRVQPFLFYDKSNTEVWARSAGLEGFLYRKLELGANLDPDRLGQDGLKQADHYFIYLQALLAPYEWTATLRQTLAEIQNSALSSQDKDRRLNEALIAAITVYQDQLVRLDPSRITLRGLQIYQILARAYNKTKPGNDFFDSLDGEELRDIVRRTFSNAIWPLDVYKIGKINRWGTGGGSPYAIAGYIVKLFLGGAEGLKGLVQRAHEALLQVWMDEIPNHASLDSDELKEHPEDSIHIIPPLELSDEEIMAAVPSRGTGIGAHPIFELIHHGNQRYLVHHPVSDGGDMWIDMFQRDYTQASVRQREAARMAKLFKEFGIDGVRQDMVYGLLREAFVPQWLGVPGDPNRKGVLNQEMEWIQAGWLRQEMAKLIEGMKGRAAVWQRQKEAITEIDEAIKGVDENARTIAEIYSYETGLIAAGTDGNYNKNDHDLRLGQNGLYDSMVSRNGARIRAALKNMAFKTWALGGAALVSFFGNHDEINPVDRFGKHWMAAVLMSMLIRPTLVYNGAEQGVAQAQNVLGDLARSVDTGKAIPFDIKALINWLQKDPEKSAFAKLVWSKGEEFSPKLGKDSRGFSSTVWSSPDANWDTSIAMLAGRNTQTGKIIIAAANFGGNQEAAQFNLAQSPLAPFGAFRPRADRDYVLRDLASLNQNGQPREYRRSGRELLDKGLYIALDAGGVHLFEVEETNPNAPAMGPPGAAKIINAALKLSLGFAGLNVDPSFARFCLAMAQESFLSRLSRLKSRFTISWETSINWLVGATCLPFSVGQVIQIGRNAGNLAIKYPHLAQAFHIAIGNPLALKSLNWGGWTFGIIANTILFASFTSKTKKELAADEAKRAVVQAAVVQAVGASLSLVVVGQIFWAGFMPLWAFALLAPTVISGLIIGSLHFVNRLPNRLGKAWSWFGALGSWPATLFFLYGPPAQLYQLYAAPLSRGGIDPRAVMFGIIGNMFMFASALLMAMKPDEAQGRRKFLKNGFWITGVSAGVLGGLAVLGLLSYVKTIGPLWFLIPSIIISISVAVSMAMNVRLLRTKQKSQANS